MLGPVKDATILTGLDAMTIPLLRRLASGRPGNRIVVIEPDGRHPLLETARATGARIVVASPGSARALRPLLSGRPGPRLRYLYSLRPEAADNEGVLDAAKEVLRQIADPDNPPHLIARIDDPRQAGRWRDEHIAASPLWFEDAISPQETTARALVRQIYRTGARQVLLCGDSTLALAILLEVAQHAWADWELAAAAAIGEARAAAADLNAPALAGAARPGVTPPQVERVVLLDRRATDLRREYLAMAPRPIAEALPAVHARDETWRDHLLACLDGMTAAEAGRTAVVIAGSGSGPAPAPARARAGRARAEHARGREDRRALPGNPGVRAVVRRRGGTGAAFGQPRPFQRAFVVDGGAPEDTWTRIARHWHECFRLRYPAVPGRAKEPTRRPWADQDEFFREDSTLQLGSIMAAVAARGRRWVPSRAVVPGTFIELSDGDLEDVAGQEHARWQERRRKAGWRAAAAGEQDDDNARINRHLRPWADLPGETRDEEREYVRFLLEQLEAVGFMPTLPDGGPGDAADFQRIGEVRATQLTASHAWWTQPAMSCPAPLATGASPMRLAMSARSVTRSSTRLTSYWMAIAGAARAPFAPGRSASRSWFGRWRGEPWRTRATGSCRDRRAYGGRSEPSTSRVATGASPDGGARGRPRLSNCWLRPAQLPHPCRAVPAGRA